MGALYDEPVVFVDLETTGASPASARIIEVGLVVASGGALEREWSTLVNPGAPIPRTIQHFTGITDEMVREAPYFEDIADQVLEHLSGRVFVAHNARFDHGFLRRELGRIGRKLAARIVCTVRLSRRLDREAREHHLDAVIERYGLACGRRHRALPDAQALWQLWTALPARHAREDIDRALEEIVNARVVPAHLPATLADELPESPGIYRFYGENGALLYVGKAGNIRERVFQHWHAAVREGREQRLAAETRSVDWIETIGELGALLAEARQVREMKPLYNRQLRGARELWTWVVADDGAAPELAPLGQVPMSFESADCFGLYRTQSAARRALTALAREERLCLKALGLEAGAGSCFAYQLGRCAGACVGEEPLRRHAARLKIVFAAERLRPWPFEGPAGVRERGPDGRSQLHVFEDWRHLATISSEEELDDLEGLALSRRAPFDLEVYRIVCRHMRRGRAMGWVRLGRIARAEGLELRRVLDP
ncbi:MAG TPA: exonuclease domain-containing protein [Steroidobacteraceae bacterium]